MTGFSRFSSKYYSEPVACPGLQQREMGLGKAEEPSDVGLEG